MIPTITRVVDHIEIPHERPRQRNDALMVEEQAIFRSGLGKLMRIARIARPGAIYDASAAAQTFSDGWRLEVLEHGGWAILENGENEVPTSEKKEDFERMSGFSKFMGDRQKGVNTSNLLKKNKKIGTWTTHFTVQNLIFSKKGIRKLKGEGVTKLSSQSYIGAKNEIAIEIHCDAGQMLTKTGSRSQIGI